MQSKIDPMLYHLHARKASYQRKVERMICSLRQLDPARCYVSFSAGKDSAVLAHAAHAVVPGVPICMVDPGVPTHWTAGERSAWIGYAERSGWNLCVFQWDKWNDTGIASAPSAGAHAKAAHASMFADLHAWAMREGRDHALIGIRAEESKGRRASLSTHSEAYRASDGITRIAPLGRWNTDDVWAYIITHELPWLAIYDALGPEARNGLIGRSGIEHGRMVYLRQYFPDAYRHARDVLGLHYAR